MTYEEQKEFLEKFQNQMKELLLSKGNDYSNIDCLSNFKATAAVTQQHPRSTVLTMIGIKVARLGVLLNTSKEVKNEAIEDTVIDLANYAFLLACTIKDTKNEIYFKESK